MKIKKLILKNFAKFTDFTLEFGNEITRLVGFNGAGKTTIGLTAIWATLKGINEKGVGCVIGDRFQFIGSKGKTSDLEVQLLDEKTGESITCHNHMSAGGNKITFTSSNGRQLTADWINTLFNYVFMSAKAFCSLSGKEQALKLGIDVSKIDAEIKALKAEYTIINRQLKDIGSLPEVAKVDPVDVSALIQKKEAIRKSLNELYLVNVEHNKKLRVSYNAALNDLRIKNEAFNKKQDDISTKNTQIHDHLLALQGLGYTGSELTKWYCSLPEPQPKILETTLPEPIYIPERPDDSELVEIDNKINRASVTNTGATLYAEYLKDKAKKDAKTKALADNDKAQADKEKERLDFIASFKFGFAGLSVDEDGGLLLTGRPIREPYFSKGEVEMIVAKIATSIDSEWKTRFIDDFDLLDEPHQEKLLRELLAAGYQVITAEVGETATKDGSIVLRECKIVDDKETENQISLF